MRKLNSEIENLTTQTVKNWLLDYAWSGTPETQEHEVECIMSQDGVLEIVDALTERYAGQAFDDEQATEAQGLALSSLYECHSGPHLPTCPRHRSHHELLLARPVVREGGRVVQWGKLKASLSPCMWLLECDRMATHFESDDVLVFVAACDKCPVASPL